MSSPEDQDEDKRYQTKRSASPILSVASMKSESSMGTPIVFKGETESSDLTVVLDADSEVQPMRAEVAAGNVKVMKEKNQQSRTKELDPAWRRTFKAKLQKNFQMINEGVQMFGKSKLLNEIYTELHIALDWNGENSSKVHEVKYIEKAHRDVTTEEIIKYYDIFKPLPGDESPIRTVLTEGIAGIGKTVCVQKFVLDWAEGKANQDLDLIFPFNFRELNFKKKECFSLLELLHFYFPETKKLDYHHYRIMFIFDGLDESRFTLDFLNSKKLTDPTESVSLDILFINLISGNLLPSAFLWITSRPAASGQIPSVYIDRVTEVRGFSDIRKDEYFRRRISDRTLANKIITHLKSSRSLYIMCHIPVFCWIAANVLEGMFSEAETGEIPKTLTQMFTHFLILQIKRGCTKYKKQKMDPGQMNDIVLKLGKLAFQQLEKRNLIFYEDDLMECGIDVREATVYSGVCTQIFIEEVSSHLGKVYSFVHLSVQEHLAAVFVFLSCVNGNLSKQQFPEVFGLSSEATLLDLLKSAVDKALNSKTGHLDLFLRFLMGLSLESNSLLLKKQLTETGHSNLSKNAAATNKEITSYIKEKINNVPSICHSIQLFHCLNELNDKSVIQEVQTFVSKTENNCLNGVHLSQVQWSAMNFLLLNSDEKLDVFNLHKYAVSEDCFIKLCPAITFFRKAELNNSNLTAKSGEFLANILTSSCSSVRELELSDNPLQDSGVKMISSGIKNRHCKLEILRLCKCDLTKESCGFLASVLTLESTRLTELCLSHNKLQDSGVKHLSEALQSPNCKLQTLRLFDCGVTQEGVSHLISALISNPSHLRELDLGGNKIKDTGVELISNFLNNELCKLEILKLCDCHITDESRISLIKDKRSLTLEL